MIKHCAVRSNQTASTMIPNHPRFIEAVHEKKKVRLRFYSKDDSGILDLICAPMDYDPGSEIKDGLNRYWLWDYGNNTDSHTLSLAPQQIVDLQVSGEAFDPAEFGVRIWQWSTPRDWGSQPQSMNAPALITVAARSVGAQAQRSETTPANKK